MLYKLMSLKEARRRYLDKDGWQRLADEISPIVLVFFAVTNVGQGVFWGWMIWG